MNTDWVKMFGPVVRVICRMSGRWWRNATHAVTTATRSIRTDVS